MQALDQTELTSADILFMSLKELGVSPSVDSFDDRKRVQKVAYLLQQCGVRLNYRYSWYLHGPYSSELTSDLYQIATRPDYFANRTHGQTFVPDIQERLAKLKRTLDPDKMDTQVLEADASILYMGRGWKHVISAVKPGLSEDVLDKAQQLIRKLVEQGLIEKNQVD